MTIDLNNVHYMILIGDPKGDYIPERSYDDTTSLFETVLDIAGGEFTNVRRVLASTRIGMADVSEQIARLIAGYYRAGDFEERPAIDFIEEHCGVGTVLPAAA